jgi:hypothetical protein
VPVAALPVVVRAVVMPVTCVVMVVVMAAGSGQRIAHASQHASDSALQHINTYDPEAGAKQMQQRQAGTCPARAGFATARSRSHSSWTPPGPDLYCFVAGRIGLLWRGNRTAYALPRSAGLPGGPASAFRG